MYSYPYDHSEMKAVKHWNCYWREVLTQMFNTEVIRAHPYIWLWKGKTKRQYRSWHSALSVTSINRFVGSFEAVSSPENKYSWCFLDCPTSSANIAHIIKTHFVVKSIIIIIIMLFIQGAHITKGVIQWGPAKKKKNVKFERLKIVKNTILKCSIKLHYKMSLKNCGLQGLLKN